MQTISNLIAYLKRHPGYIARLIGDIFKLFWYKCTGKKILVITTGSGGIGDYLWIRSYYPLIRQKGYKTVLIAMAHWKEIVETFDGGDIGIIRYFESCLSPKKIETFFFKLFKTEVYLNFRKKCMANIVKYKTTYNDDWLKNDDIFYEEKNNNTFKQFSPLPDNFKHQLPIIEPSKEKNNILRKPFVVLVEGGNTQGKLSDSQLASITKHITDKGYFILINGNYERLRHLVDNTICSKIIDGSLFTFPQYTYIVNEASFIVTVNTSIYHFAVQLNKPLVAISCNEYHTLQCYKENQQLVFNDTLQSAYNSHTLSDYTTDGSVDLTDIDIERILKAIDDVKCN